MSIIFLAQLIFQKKKKQGQTERDLPWIECTPRVTEHPV